MRINELAKKTGLTASAIRFYERAGIFEANHIRRGENNYRDFDEEAVEHLLALKDIHAAGFTLAELKELYTFCNQTDGIDIERVEAFLRQKIAAIKEKMAELERAQGYLTTTLAELLHTEDAPVLSS